MEQKKHKLSAVLIALLVLATTTIPAYATPGYAPNTDANGRPIVPFAVSMEVTYTKNTTSYTEWVTIEAPYSNVIFQNAQNPDQFNIESGLYGSDYITTQWNVVAGENGGINVPDEIADRMLDTQYYGSVQGAYITPTTWKNSAGTSSGSVTTVNQYHIEFADFASKLGQVPEFYLYVQSTATTVILNYDISYPVIITNPDLTKSQTMVTEHKTIQRAVSPTASPNLGLLINGEISRLEPQLNGGYALITNMTADLASTSGIGFAYSCIDTESSSSFKPLATQASIQEYYSRFLGNYTEIPEPESYSLGNFFKNTINGFFGVELYNADGFRLTLGSIFGGMLAVFVLIAVIKWLGV